MLLKELLKMLEDKGEFSPPSASPHQSSSPGTPHLFSGKEWTFRDHFLQIEDPELTIADFPQLHRDAQQTTQFLNKEHLPHRSAPGYVLQHKYKLNHEYTKKFILDALNEITAAEYAAEGPFAIANTRPPKIVYRTNGNMGIDTGAGHPERAITTVWLTLSSINGRDIQVPALDGTQHNISVHEVAKYITDKLNTYYRKNPPKLASLLETTVVN